MPGILPMKVIKVGTSSQSRIAQACDRCRSKKIRCDGIRPTCSQCSNVGFECKTSDKLSRRAFPRGYTESLEERVRQLETEVRELKDLLDEKDEKIDILSKMDSNRQRQASTSSPAATSLDSPGTRKEAGQTHKVDTFRIQPTPLLLGVENSDSYFMGSSSGRSFIETFKRKLKEVGKPCDFNPDAFLHIQGCPAVLAESRQEQPLRAPPRIFSDRCVNVYFQEWAPLFPVLHKPTFLCIYEEFVADPDKVKSKHKLAQLYLVFSIAGLASDAPDYEQLAACEKHWRRSLDSVLVEDTVATLQCLLLALLYFSTRADYKSLQHYKGVAVSLSHRLGLHQSQKRFSFGALTMETRKKVFWTLYTLDCFTTAVLGLPKLLHEEDVHAEYPADTDDEYVTEKGFQPTLPGECTRLSGALALFRASRILAQVLEQIYPAATPHGMSLHQMVALANDLDAWCEELPSHLKLNFAQDKPSTDVTGSRSPLLALAYNFIRMLIFRPAVGSSLGSKAAPALLSIVESSKHIIQIVQLLEERNMTFSICLNKGDVLVICGLSLLYQITELKVDSKLLRDNKRLVNSVSDLLDKSRASGSLEFGRIAAILNALDKPAPKPSSTKGRGGSMAAPVSRKMSAGASSMKHKSKGPNGRLPTSASENDLLQQQQKLRRMTVPAQLSQRPRLHKSASRQSFDNQTIDSPTRRNSELPSGTFADAGLPTLLSQARNRLDSIPFGVDPFASDSPSPVQTLMQPPSMMSPQQQSQQAQQQQQQQQLPSSLASELAMLKSLRGSHEEWEAMPGAIDGEVNNVYDAIYGGGTGFVQDVSTAASAETNTNSDWSPDTFDLSTFHLEDYDPKPGQCRSVHSTSEESLSSGEDGVLMTANMNAMDECPPQLFAMDTGSKSYLDALSF